MKNASYFQRVTQQTPTEFWINNPTRTQADLAISHAATGLHEQSFLLPRRWSTIRSKVRMQ